jgi:hypothetical protein
MSFSQLIRRPGAFIPLLMSFAALATVGIALAVVGVNRQADEGAAAHLWQVLMLGQAPFVLVFMVRWLPKAFRPALAILALQAIAFLAAAFPVFYFQL